MTPKNKQDKQNRSSTRSGNVRMLRSWGENGLDSGGGMAGGRRAILYGQNPENHTSSEG